ncbi:hypothetical protein DRJ48_05015, partial [Candidatus Woesearchaeota archaeon]
MQLSKPTTPSPNKRLITEHQYEIACLAERLGIQDWNRVLVVHFIERYAPKQLSSDVGVGRDLEGLRWYVSNGLAVEYYSS